MGDNKILYSIYTGGFPNQAEGGPNNIIYKIIKNNPSKNYHFDYLSSDLFFEGINKDNLETIGYKRTVKKRLTSILYEKFGIYRKIFSSDFYLPFHFKKKEKYFKRIADLMKEYDIIHSQDSVSLALLETSEFSNTKKIITVHSKGPLSNELKYMAKNEFLRKKIDKELKKLERVSVGIADVITFPSIAAKKIFEKNLDLSLENKRTKIIYNGIDIPEILKIGNIDIFNQYLIKKTDYEIILLNVGAHVKEKRIDVLLKVTNVLINKFKKKVLLINIGKGTDSQYLSDLVDKLNIRSNVMFLGQIPNSDVISFMKATDLFIMTSEKVIFDLVVLEALACGTCCVVSNDGGNKEIIKDGVNGFLIDTNNVEETARKIISILPYRNSVRENALRTAKQFSVDRMVNEYFELYESLLK